MRLEKPQGRSAGPALQGPSVLTQQLAPFKKRAGKHSPRPRITIFLPTAFCLLQLTERDVPPAVKGSKGPESGSFATQGADRYGKR